MTRPFTAASHPTLTLGPDKIIIEREALSMGGPPGDWKVVRISLALNSMHVKQLEATGRIVA